jgi:hypothetical protein
VSPYTEWLGNAGVYENARREAQELADRYTREENAELAAWWQDRADEHKRVRDLEQRREEDRRFRRRVFRRHY